MLKLEKKYIFYLIWAIDKFFENEPGSVIHCIAASSSVVHRKLPNLILISIESGSSDTVSSKNWKPFINLANISILFLTAVA